MVAKKKHCAGGILADEQVISDFQQPLIMLPDPLRFTDFQAHSHVLQATTSCNRDLERQ
jgi:hypothetical protein